MKRRFFLVPVLLAGLILFFIDMKHEPGGAVYHLYGFAHLAFFILLAYLLSRIPSLALRPFPQQLSAILCVVLLVGGIIEVIQPYFGPTARWRDLGVDLVGGLLGIMFLAPARRGLSRRVLTLAQIAVVAAAVMVFSGPVVTIWDMRQASKQFLVLGDFETRFETKRWSSGEIDKGIARHGESTLRVPLPVKTYSGTTLKRSFGDWRGYSTFAFSLYNPDPQPLPITVSIRDEEHFRRGGEFNDRFNRIFTMEQGWNDISIPIADIEEAPAARKLGLDHLRL